MNKIFGAFVICTVVGCSSAATDEVEDPSPANRASESEAASSQPTAAAEPPAIPTTTDGTAEAAPTAAPEAVEVASPTASPSNAEPVTEKKKLVLAPKKKMLKSPPKMPKSLGGIFDQVILKPAKGKTYSEKELIALVEKKTGAEVLRTRKGGLGTILIVMKPSKETRTAEDQKALIDSLKDASSFQYVEANKMMQIRR